MIISHNFLPFFCSLTSPINNRASSESSGSESSDSSESEEEENNRDEEEEEMEVRETQPEIKNDLPEENEVKKWNLGSFLTEQKSPNEAPQSHEPVKATKMEVDREEGENGTENESNSSGSESNEESDDGEIKRTPSEHNFDHENSSSSLLLDKSPPPLIHERDSPMPPPSKDKSPKTSSIKCSVNDIESAFEFLKTLPMQPLSSLSDSDEKMEVPQPNNASKKKRPAMKRSKAPPTEELSSSDEDNASQYSTSSKARRRPSIDADKRRGRPPKKNISTQPNTYDQQPPPSDISCSNNNNITSNGAKKQSSTTPSSQSHKSPRISSSASAKDTTATSAAAVVKKTKNSIKSKPTITSSDESSADEEDLQPKSKVPKTNSNSSRIPTNHNSSNNSKKKHEISKNPRHEVKHPVRKVPSRSSSLSSTSSHSDSDHSTNNNKFHQLQSSPVPQSIMTSRPSSSMQQRSLPPAAASVHRNDSTDQSDSDDSSHRVSKGKVKEVKKGNESGDKIKKMALGKLFSISTKPAGSNNEGLGKGGKNGGKKPIGQVVVVSEETQSKFNTSDHVQSHHPKYAASPSIMVRIDLSRLDVTRLGIPMEKLKSAGLLKTPQVPEPQQQPQKRPSSINKRRRSSAHDDEEQNWSSKKAKNVDRLSVSSSTSSSSSSSSSSSDALAAASSSRVSFPLDRLNNIEHKPLPSTSTKESFYHSPSSVDTKLTKIKREQKLASPQKESKDVKSKVKQEKSSELCVDTSGMRNRSHSMTNASSQPQQTYKDSKKKKLKTSHDENVNGTSSTLIPPTNHDRISLLVNGDLSNISAIVPTTTTIVKRVFVSYFERNNDNAEQAEMR